MELGKMVKRPNYHIKELSKNKAQDLVDEIAFHYTDKLTNLIFENNKDLTAEEIIEIKDNILTKYSKKIIIQELRKLDDVVKDRDMEINGIGIKDVSSVRLERGFNNEDLESPKEEGFITTVKETIEKDLINDLNEKYKKATGRYLDEDKIENIKKVIIPPLGRRNIREILERTKDNEEELNSKNKENNKKKTIEISGLKLNNLLKEDKNFWKINYQSQDITPEIFKNSIQKVIHRQGLSKNLIVLFDEKNMETYLKRYPLIE